MWLLLAAMASMFWGMSYVFSEQLYRHISVLTSLAIEMFIISLVIAAAALWKGNFKPDLATIGSSRTVLWLLVASIVTFLVGELGIGFAINGKNATLASLIEISYPLFVALFAYLFYSENELNVGTALGGLLVFCGVCVIYFFSR
jgi:drug/metabolite transporter (DMT)-like permease